MIIINIELHEYTLYITIQPIIYNYTKNRTSQKNIYEEHRTLGERMLLITENSEKYYK